MSELVDEATLAALAKAEVERHTPVDDSTIDYGCVSANLEGHRAETFYISTAISL